MLALRPTFASTSETKFWFGIVYFDPENQPIEPNTSAEFISDVGSVDLFSMNSGMLTLSARPSFPFSYYSPPKDDVAINYMEFLVRYQECAHVRTESHLVHRLQCTFLLR